MIKPENDFILHQNEDGSVQLRDNHSLKWCECGLPAVEHFTGYLPWHQFKCVKHAREARRPERIPGLEQTP